MTILVFTRKCLSLLLRHILISPISNSCRHVAVCVCRLWRLMYEFVLTKNKNYLFIITTINEQFCLDNRNLIRNVSFRYGVYPDFLVVNYLTFSKLKRKCKKMYLYFIYQNQLFLSHISCMSRASLCFIAFFGTS